MSSSGKPVNCNFVGRIKKRAPQYSDRPTVVGVEPNSIVHRNELLLLQLMMPMN
jgi:hypothetical protein